MTPSHHSQRGRGLALNVGLTALLVFATAEGAYALSVGGVVSVWFPSGVSLGLLLLCEPRVWPAVLLGIALGNVGADALHVADPWLLSTAWIANIVESVLAATVVRWWSGGSRYVSSLRGVGALVLGAAVLSNAVTAVLGGGVLTLFAGGTFESRWLIWWIGDGLGMLVVTPLIVAVADQVRLRPTGREVRVIAAELAIFLVSATVLGALVFRQEGVLSPSLAAVVFPLLIAAALRRNLSAYAVLLVCALIVLVYSAQGRGPLTGADLSSLRRVVEILAYLGLASISTLVLAAITRERERAVRLARESEARYRALLDTAQDAILTVDANRRIDLVSPSLEGLVDRTAAELAGRPLDILFPPATVGALFRDEAPRVGGGGERAGDVLPVELPLLHASGREIPVEVAHGSGEVGGEAFTTLIVRDISQRKREEQQRDLLQSQLQQARKLEAVGRLTGGVAHDYNNMLTVINGHAEFALEVVPEDSPVVEHIREIQSAAEHSAQLTRQLLGFARRQVIAPRSLDLNVTLYAMLKMVRTLVGEDVTVHWRPGADLWLVQADPTQIQQVVMNLCSNGRDAISDSGTVVIETRNWVFDESYRENHAGFVPGEFVMLAVTDDGVGMSEETLSHAFEPFFSTKESGRGTGLGLASVYGIAKQNGGFVNVYSEPGSGTAVKLYLPRHVAMEGVDGHPQRSADLAATGRGAVVLVVEDNAAILQLATRTLERDGHTVLAADTPEHALSAARDLDWAVDLMVTDVILPGMNGRELAEQVIARNPRVRVLFTSGYTENVIAQRGVLKEGVHFLSKPYTPQSLLEKVVEILR